MTAGLSYPFTWRDPRFLRRLRNKRCRIVARGIKNSVTVEFEDGNRLTTCLSYLGRAER